MRAAAAKAMHAAAAEATLAAATAEAMRAAAAEATRAGAAAEAMRAAVVEASMTVVVEGFCNRIGIHPHSSGIDGLPPVPVHINQEAVAG